MKKKIKALSVLLAAVLSISVLLRTSERMADPRCATKCSMK